MNQDKIGKLIKELRTKSNLTQKEFADKYNVTYQAVSKWENGKNLPDTLLLKQICNDYNINIDDILEGNAIHKKINYSLILIPLVVTLGLIILFVHNSHKQEEFTFKTISSNCNDFKLNGSIAYNEKKSVIYISNIEYCGTNEDEIYSSIVSNLYEKNNNLESIIGTSDKNTNVTLKEYLKNVTFNINNDKTRLCKNYNNDNLYLQIHATKKDNQTIIFSIPLSIKSC